MSHEVRRGYWVNKIYAGCPNNNISLYIFIYILVIHYKSNQVLIKS